MSISLSWGKRAICLLRQCLPFTLSHSEGKAGVRGVHLRNREEIKQLQAPLGSLRSFGGASRSLLTQDQSSGKPRGKQGAGYKGTRPAPVPGFLPTLSRRGNQEAVRTTSDSRQCHWWNSSTSPSFSQSVFEMNVADVIDPIS